MFHQLAADLVLLRWSSGKTNIPSLVRTAGIWDPSCTLEGEEGERWVPDLVKARRRVRASIPRGPARLVREGAAVVLVDCPHNYLVDLLIRARRC